MRIEDYFWVIIIIVGAVLSGLQKLLDSSKARRRMYQERMERGRERSEVTMRTAKRRDAQQPATPTSPKPPQLEDVIRRLMGEENAQTLDGTNEEEGGAEEEWQPVPPPAIRRAPPEPQRRPAQRVQ